MIKLKRFGTYLGLWLGSLSFVIFSLTPVSNAATPTTITVQQTPSPSSAPAVIITSIVGSTLPSYIELYNQGDKPASLHGWGIVLTTHDVVVGGCSDTQTTISLPDAWLLPAKYLTLEQTAAPDPAAATVPFSIDAGILLAGCLTPELATVAVIGADSSSEQTVTIPANEWSATTALVAQHKQRNNSPNSTRNITGVFDTDYKFVTGAIALNSDPLYTPPVDAAGLQIMEILPNARACAPTETNPVCNDYVKFYNPTSQAINLATYRLRIGYKGQSESIANTFTWNQGLDPAQDELILPPLTYFMLTARNDGQPLSITDGGNYVWLEDSYGTVVYDPVVQYPDASSVTRVGQAWAYDGAAWNWTSAPQPGAANYFPPVTTSSPTSNASTILTPCAADQYRNPATNRCKSIVVASSALTPCGPGQERNPETNRCRSIATASSTLASCQLGWERNPATNRCRKAVAAVAGAATTAVKDVVAPSVDNTGWFVALLVMALATAYAVYEWRQEITLYTLRCVEWAQTRLPYRHKR